MKIKDPKVNGLRLKLHREKKKAYRKRVNESKENQTRILPSPHFPTSQWSAGDLVMNALPKTPNKRNKIVQSLSQKFNLWTVLNSKKPGRPENDLSEYEVEWLCQFKDRLTITHSNTWKKDQRYIGKENGKIKFVPICYLLWTIRDLLEIINGCSGILQGRPSSNSFQKLTFRQLY